jgi:hypothetical protein
VRLVEEWTDNFRLASTDPESNLRSGLSAGLALLLDDPTISGEVSYAPFVFDDTISDGIGVHHSFGGELGWQATPRLRLSSQAGYTRTDDPAGADRLDLRRGRGEFTRIGGSVRADYAAALWAGSTYYRVSHFDSSDETTLSQTIGGTASRSFGQTNTLTAGYEYLDSETERDRVDPLTDFFAARAGTSTTRGHQFTGTYLRELTAVMTGGLSGAYAIREQTGRFGDSDFSRWSVSLFNNYALPGTISVRSSIGVSQLLPSSGDASDLLLITDSSLTYVRGPATFAVGIEQGFSETFAEGQNSGVVETFGVSASVLYQFTPLLRAGARARYRENDFSAGQSGDAEQGRQEETAGFSVHGSYDLLRWLTANVEYIYTETTSSVTGRGYVENRVTASVTARFD